MQRFEAYLEALQTSYRPSRTRDAMFYSLYAEVLYRHVGAAVELGGYARIGADYLYVLLRVGAGYGDLIADAPRGEAGKGGYERDEAVGREPGGDGRHVLLGYAHVEGPAGVLFPQLERGVGVAEVGVEHAEALILRHGLEQVIAECFSHLHGRHLPESPLIAASYCSFVTLMLWQPTPASIANWTP